MSIRVLTEEPIVVPLAEMKINPDAQWNLNSWLADRRPECFEKGKSFLLPNDDDVTDNELLCELSGRKCYNSFGVKAGRKSTREYLAHIIEIGHNSVLYHAKMSFFIAGISRRLLQELIRHYVGADRDVEGSPSVESTRFVRFNGFYVAHPFFLDNEINMESFKMICQANFIAYNCYVDAAIEEFAATSGNPPKGLDKKRIFESASQLLIQAAETSLVWTSNPVALKKMFTERTAEAADLEFRRLAGKWQSICQSRWPGLFPLTQARI